MKRFRSFNRGRGRAVRRYYKKPKGKRFSRGYSLSRGGIRL